MALEEPSVSEVVRAIDARTIRIEQQLNGFVPRELYDRDMAEIRADITELKAKGQRWWTGLAMPAMVVGMTLALQELIK